MRVLFWSSSFWPSIGGVGVLAAKFVAAMRKRGYQYIVVTPQDICLSGKSEYEGIPVYPFPFWQSMANIDEFMEVRQSVAELKRTFAPDLIHINALNRSNFFHHLTLHAHHSPVLVTLHGIMASQADRLIRRTLCSADWVTGCSTAILDEGRRLAPKINSRSSVIHNALDAPTLQPAPLSFDSPHILCLGRLVEEKGFDVALAGFALLVDRFPHARLIIAGDGPARVNLEQQASHLGISHAVDFVGWIAPENVPELINKATVVVIPSRWEEAFGLVALEAALMARPIVATRVGGLPEVVLDWETGLLIEKEDSQALARAIEFLLDRPILSTEMGQAARTRANQEFSWDQHIDAYDDLYQRLIIGTESPGSQARGNTIIKESS